MQWKPYNSGIGKRLFDSSYDRYKLFNEYKTLLRVHQPILSSLRYWSIFLLNKDYRLTTSKQRTLY